MQGKGRPWTEEEDRRLLELSKERVKDRHEHFQNRTKSACNQRLTALKKGRAKIGRPKKHDKAKKYGEPQAKLKRPYNKKPQVFITEAPVSTRPMFAIVGTATEITSALKELF